jgi:signal transduction histidine kinase
VSSPLIVGDLALGNGTTSSDEIRLMLARELHDRVAQTLTTMLIELENFKVEQTGRQSALRQLDELQESTRDVLTNLRRVLYDLRDETGIEEGFVDAVRGLLARFQERTHVNVRFSVAPSWPSRLRSQAALNIMRIIEEALTNVRLHSGAGLVEVALGAESGAGSRAPGMGVLGMQERALLLGGRIEVETVAGGGTTVRAILPKEQLI